MSYKKQLQAVILSKEVTKYQSCSVAQTFVLTEDTEDRCLPLVKACYLLWLKRMEAKVNNWGSTVDQNLSQFLKASM